MSLRKIDERTFWGEQGLEPSEYLASGSRHKAVPNSRDIDQIVSPVIPYNDGIYAVGENDYNSRDCLDGVWVQLGRHQRLSPMALEF
jgi:hypothetical protein